MISKIRILARLCIVVAPVAAFLPTTASYAADTVAYASSTGTGASCTFAQPCGIGEAIYVASPTGGVGRVICLDALTGPANSSNGIGINNQTFEMDCPLVFLQNIQVTGTNMTVRLLGLNFTNSEFGLAISFSGSGTLILENCAFVDQTLTALEITPNGPLIL